MGSDISWFKNILAGYKSTINIALGDANLYVLSPIVVPGQANVPCEAAKTSSFRYMTHGLRACMTIELSYYMIHLRPYKMCNEVV